MTTLKMCSAPNYLSVFSDSDYTTINSASEVTVVPFNNADVPDSSTGECVSSTETSRSIDSSNTSSCAEYLSHTTPLSSSTSQIVSSHDPQFLSTVPTEVSTHRVPTELSRPTAPVSVETSQLCTCDNVYIYKNKRDQLNFWRLQKRFCDVKVACKDTLFFAHRAVLTNASLFYANEIDMGIRESLSETDNEPNGKCNSKIVVCNRKEAIFFPYSSGQRTNVKNRCQLRNSGIVVVSSSTPERPIGDAPSRHTQAVKISRLTLNSHLSSQPVKHRALVPITSPLRTQSDCTGLIDKSKYNATRMPQHGCLECKPYATESANVETLPSADSQCTNEIHHEELYLSMDDGNSQARLERCSSCQCLYDEPCELSKDLTWNTESFAIPKRDSFGDECTLTITVEFLSPLILKTLLEFIYTGNLFVLQDVPVNYFDAINEAAAQLGLKDWIDLFEPEIIQQALTMTNFIDVWDLAEERSIEKVQFEVAFFLVKNVGCLCTSDLFLKMPYKKIDKLLSSLEYFQRLREENLKVLIDSIEREELDCKPSGQRTPGFLESYCADPVESKKGAETRVSVGGRRKRCSDGVTSFLCRLPKTALVSQDGLPNLDSRSNSCTSPSTDSEQANSMELDFAANSSADSTVDTEQLNISSESWFYLGNKNRLDVHSGVPSCSQKQPSEVITAGLPHPQSAEHPPVYPPFSNRAREISVDASTVGNYPLSNVSSYQSMNNQNNERFKTDKNLTPGQPVQLNLLPYTPLNNNALSAVRREQSTGFCPQISKSMMSKLGDTLRTSSPFPSIVVLGDTQQGEMLTIKCNQNDDYWEESARLSLEPTNTPVLAFLNAFTVLLTYSFDAKPYKCEFTLVQQTSVVDDSASLMYDLPAFLQPRRRCAAFVLGSELCVCGGEEYGSGALREVEDCNLGNKDLKWARMPSMWFKRAHHSVVWYNGFVYVVGGNTTRCEKYDPVLNVWLEVPSLPSIFLRFEPVPVAVEHHLIVMSSYMPGHFHELNESVGLWRCTKVVGNPPGHVVSATSWDSSVFTLDDRRSICWFNMQKPIWKVVTQFLDDFVPLHICITDPHKSDAKC